MKYIFILIGLFLASENAFASAACNSTSPIRLSDLKYIGKPLTEIAAELGQTAALNACVVVKNLSNDTVAINACKKRLNGSTNFFVYNPGNPQYVGEGHGAYETNNYGYYFCIGGGLSKQSMCEFMSRKFDKNKLKVNWVKKGSAKGNDGDCMCSKPDSKEAAFVCPSEVDAILAAEDCNGELATKVNGKCICKSDNQTELKPGEKCPDPTPVVTNEFDDNKLNICLQELIDTRNSCKDSSKNTLNKCSKENPEFNKNINQAQNVLGQGLDGIIAANAGTGALNSCIKMGAAGTVLIQSLSLLKNNCSTEITKCKDDCSKLDDLLEKTNEDFIAECKEKFDNEPFNEVSTEPFTEAYEKRFLERLAEEKSLAKASENICVADAKSKQDELDSFLYSLSQNVQQANICQCQLTAASIGQTNCQGLVGPMSCLQNPSQPGCVFSTISCRPGSANPVCVAAAPFLGGGGGSGLVAPPSGFAGPGFPSSGLGAGASGKNSGIDNMDLSGLNDNEARSVSASASTADLASPFGAAGSAGGGGGFGGGGGGSSDSGSLAAADGSESNSSGLSGLFNTARTSLGNLFGKGNNNANSANGVKKNKAFKGDPNAFRPKGGLRGIASSKEFGSKNRDIWKTMSERYSDQYHTFITVETPSK